MKFMIGVFILSAFALLVVAAFQKAKIYMDQDPSQDKDDVQ